MTHVICSPVRLDTVRDDSERGESARGVPIGVFVGVATISSPPSSSVVDPSSSLSTLFLFATSEQDVWEVVVVVVELALPALFSSINAIIGKSSASTRSRGRSPSSVRVSFSAPRSSR